MSRGSTMERARRRALGIPVSAKEKLRIAILGLTRIALEPAQATGIAIKTLDIIGIRPKKEVESATETT